MRNKEGFSWGPGNIPGRRIEVPPGDTIAVYNSTGKHILGSELGQIKPFITPPEWIKEAEEFVESLKKPKKSLPKQGVVFEAIQTEVPNTEVVEIK